MYWCADTAVGNVPFLVARQDMGIPTAFAGLLPKVGSVCETIALLHLSRKQGQLLKSWQLKREAISEPWGMSDTYS